MRANEFLFELATHPYPFSKKMAHNDLIRYGFVADNNDQYVVEIRVSAYEHEYYDSMMVVFGVVRGDEMQTSATGNQKAGAIRVFSTVIECVKAALAHFEQEGDYINIIGFSASAAEPSRVALYRRFAQGVGRFLPGWSFFEEINDGNEIELLISRPPRDD